MPTKKTHQRLQSTARGTITRRDVTLMSACISELIKRSTLCKCTLTFSKYETPRRVRGVVVLTCFDSVPVSSAIRQAKYRIFD